VHPPLTPQRERYLLLTLAGIQFSHVLDFMIMMPLGPILIAEFGINHARVRPAGRVLTAFPPPPPACSPRPM